LTHLFSREFQLFLGYGQSEALKNDLWGGRFSNLPIDLKAKFDEFNQPYRQSLSDLYFSDLKRLAYDTEPTGRLYIEPYDAISQRIDLKLQKEYRF